MRQVVINAEAITDLDTTGVEMLARLYEDLQLDGVGLAFARVRSHVMRMMERTGLAATIGSDRFFLQVDEAVPSCAHPKASPTRLFTPSGGCSSTGNVV